MVVPSCVDFVIDVLVPDIGGQAQPLTPVLIGRRRVDHKGRVEHDVSRLVVRGQPTRIETLRHVGQVL